jgi:hypothetical protein
MVRAFILFVAYKACSGKDIVIGANPFQYRNSVSLIAMVFFLHVIQVLLLFGGKSFLPVKSIDEIAYLAIIGCFLLLFYLCELIFSKRILAKAIRQYKKSGIARYAKFIAFGYMVINIVIVVLMITRRY